TDDVAAFALLQAVEAGAGEFLTSYESMSRRVLEIRRRHTPGLRIGFADDDALPELAVLIELSSTTPAGGGLDLQELLAGLLADAAAAGHVVDAVFGDPVRLWELRHGLTEHTREGHSDWVDVSLPRSRIPEFRRRLQALVDADHPDWIPLDLGHYGDGGLHVGLLFPFHHGRPPDPGETAALRGAVYGLIAELDGTFSAEHGIGPYNQRYYHQLKDPVFQEISGRLKALFDPKGILGSFSLGPAPDK
ncbi:MAG: FAD-binding oxidoreductase, partial [Acidimicrobiia bacterium]